MDIFLPIVSSQLVEAQSEFLQILLKTVAVIGNGFVLPAFVEQLSAGIRHGPGLPAYFNDAFQLKGIKAIQAIPGGAVEECFKVGRSSRFG